jgi:glycosyltransferase involved in cell wall biosynthesis
MRLFSLVLARDEADPSRYLRRVLERCREFSDAVLFLDDGSTDHTPEVARKYGSIVRRRKSDTAAWGNESPARQQLWEFGLDYATERDDWLLVCDADMEFRGDPRALCQTRELNAWAVVLHDMWTPTQYRSDQFWQGHLHHRPWLFAPRRVPDGWTPQWPERGIHPGHFPPNMLLSCGFAPQDEWFYIHWAYARPEHRAEKHRQYLSQAHQLSPFERAHAESILDFDAPRNATGP